MKINIPKLNIELTGDSKISLMDQLLEAQIPVANTCGGEAVCAKCAVTVEKGLENLTPPDLRETELARTKNLKSNERLSCQCTLKGSVTLSTTYW